VDPCPKCGAVDAADRCPHCGIVVARYREYLDKLRAGPAGPGPVDTLTLPATTAPTAWGAARSDLEPAPPRVRRESTAAHHRLRFHGFGSSLFGLWVVNVFLTLVTLGVYAAWARVKVRRYLLSQTSFAGDRFAYHGTGEELVRGYLKAAVVFGLPFYALAAGPDLVGASPTVTIGAEVVAWTLAVALVPVAIVGARRYRLSRTSWRGIRFAFRGPTFEYVKIFLGGGLLTLLTLGVHYPIWATRRQSFLVSHSYFGSQRCRFDGDGRPLRRSYGMAMLLLLPTLGLSWFWFAAARDRYFAHHTSLGRTRLHSAVTGIDLLLLKLANGLLLVLTLGFAYPWNVARNLNVRYTWLSVQGRLDLDAITQQNQRVSATGEGLAGFFDTGFDLG
jgi:uncharacterized membrane protein YjgN (DUF898 family)